MSVMNDHQNKDHASMLKNILGKNDLMKKKTTRSYLEDTITTGGRGLARVLLNLKKGNKQVSVQRHKKLEKVAPVLKRINQLEDKQSARKAAYKETKYNLQKWKSIVNRNRLADQISFPLDQTDLQWSSPLEDEKLRMGAAVTAAIKAGATEETSKKDQSLNTKLFSLLYPEKSNSRKCEDDEVKLEEDAETIALQARERARLRAREAFREAKYKRQSKIKSKAYHRHLKRRRLKIYEKETAELKEKDPEAFAERMLSVDKLRIEERASQRHKIGGRFAKRQRLRAKFDTEARDAVQSMVEKSKDLSRKRKISTSSSSSDEEDIQNRNNNKQSDDEDMETSAPKLDDLKDAQDVELTSGWTQVKRRKKDAESSKSKPPVQSILNKVSIDAMLGDTAIDQSANDANFFERLEAVCKDDEFVGDLDPQLAQDFAADKAAIVNSETPADIETFVPGWNTWTGPGMEELEKRKRERNTVKAPKVNRKDDDKQRVVIRHGVNEGLKKHLVKEIPFPYETPEQYEAAICKPIGREWNTESCFRDYTKSRTVVKAGRIIQPINKNCTLIKEDEMMRLT